MRSLIVAAVLLGGLSGCASLQTPRVEVLQARLATLGLLDQQVEVELCISNPNRRELAFSRVTAEVDVAGKRLASGVNEMPVTLPPLVSVVVPFNVATTTRNLGAQLGGILGSGTIPYTVSGHVVLRDFSLVGIPYSVGGRLTPQAIAGQLAGMASEPDAPGQCGASVPASAPAT